MSENYSLNCLLSWFIRDSELDIDILYKFDLNLHYLIYPNLLFVEEDKTGVKIFLTINF